MTSPLDTINLIVIHRDESGKSTGIFPYNGDKASHMAACVILARRMIASDKALKSLIQLGNRLEEKATQLEAWYKPKSMEEVAKKFVERVLVKWPPMVVDDTFTSPDHLASTWKTKWDKDFETREHAITINGSRFSDLCAAGREAKRFSDRNSEMHQRYRRFLVIHACTMVHELGHIYVTFLSMGETNTPDGIGGYTSKGEAGSHLEILIFGGVVVALRNPAENDEQSGELHLIDEHKEYHQISQDTVDNICHHDIPFPFPSYAIDVSEKESLGHSHPVLPVKNPLEQPETIALLKAHKHYGDSVNPFNWKEVEAWVARMKSHEKPRTIRTDPQSAVHRLPFEPGLLAEAAK